MVKIIKGRKYDTDTAREVGSYSNAGGWRDFGHFEETLFHLSKVSRREPQRQE